MLILDGQSHRKVSEFGAISQMPNILIGGTVEKCLVKLRNKLSVVTIHTLTGMSTTPDKAQLAQEYGERRLEADMAAMDPGEAGEMRKGTWLARPKWKPRWRIVVDSRPNSKVRFVSLDCSMTHYGVRIHLGINHAGTCLDLLFSILGRIKQLL